MHLFKSEKGIKPTTKNTPKQFHLNSKCLPHPKINDFVKKFEISAFIGNTNPRPE